MDDNDDCRHIEDCYLKKDKYWGRSLNASQFRQAVRRFFQVPSAVTDVSEKSDCSRYQQNQTHDKSKLCYRLDVVRGIIRKLRRLQRAICAQPSMRFYSWYIIIIITN